MELSSYCLNIVLGFKKRQKLIAEAQLQGDTLQITDTEFQLRDDCLNYLKSYNQTLLIQLIRQYNNNSLFASIRGQTDSEHEFPFVNHWSVVWIWSIIFVSMIFFAIFGNCLIIWIIFRQKVMRTVVNIFLVNLTLSDLLTVSFNAPFNFVFMLTGHWPFTYVYCVFNNFINNLTIASSVFTATVMSIDRYIAIVHPLKPRMNKRRALINISVIWLCSAFFASPTIMYSQTIPIYYDNHNQRILCLMEWPDGISGQSKFDLGYNIAFLLFTYILPMLTMAVAYTLMARVLWDSRQNSLNSNVQKELIRSKQKCVRMLIAVVGVFGICWLPYHSYFLSTYIWPEIIKIKQTKQIYLAIYWLAMANSLFNPFILFIMNNRFRKCINYYIRCNCFGEEDINLDARGLALSVRHSNTLISPKKLSKTQINSNNKPENYNQSTNGNTFLYNTNEAEVCL